MIPLDEEYFTWLYSQVCNLNVKNPKKTYWCLCEQLYTKEFLWFIPNDDNRSKEGIELRKEFLQETGTEYPGHDWMNMSCSMFELLIGLSKRLSFLDDREPKIWFWELVDNINLSYANDNIYNVDVETHVDEVLNNVIWRLYNKNGSGGLFPLRHAQEDQRKIELWYQLSAYVNEELWP